MARLVLERLGKHYGGKANDKAPALAGINLEIEDGGLLVLAGPSGCGKTTLLRLVAGLEEPTTGTIQMDGQIVNSLPPRDRDAAMVFQNPVLYPHLSAFENLAFPLSLRGVARREIQARVSEMATLLGIEPLLGRAPKALSGGERQRVALGRALIRRPKVLLLDEPLSSLDLPLRQQLRAEILRLHQQFRTTLIYVTHDQQEALSMGHRLGVLSQGNLQQIADPLAIYRQPANLCVARFFGTPSMNFAAGRVRLGNRAVITMATPACELELPAQQAARLASWHNQDIVLGIRPEQVLAAPMENDPPATIAICARLQRTELQGASLYGHFSVGQQSWIAHLPDTGPLCPGTDWRLTLNLAQAHFFDPVSGSAV